MILTACARVLFGVAQAETLEMSVEFGPGMIAKGAFPLTREVRRGEIEVIRPDGRHFSVRVDVKPVGKAQRSLDLTVAQVLASTADTGDQHRPIVTGRAVPSPGQEATFAVVVPEDAGGGGIETTARVRR